MKRTNINWEAVKQVKKDIQLHVSLLRRQEKTEQEMQDFIRQNFKLKIETMHDLGLGDSIEGWINYQITGDEKHLMY